MATSNKTGTPVVLPALGEGVTEATITRWLKSPGDRIEPDEPLLEVATDKVDTEIPSPIAGILLELVVAEGDAAAVDAAIAIIGVETESASPPPPVAHPSDAPREEADDPPPAPSEMRPTDVSTRPQLDNPAPAASALVEAVDVVDATPTQHDKVERLPKIRQTIAHRMLESLRTTAQLTTVIEVDITVIAHLRTAEKEDFARRTGTNLSYLPFLAKAAVEALNEHPLLNSSINEDATEVTYHNAIHLGIAVDSPKGLMVPVIRDAQHMTVSRLATAIAEAAKDVRNGRISPDALSGGTFTLTNTGSRGALFDTPILNQPQSAILGTGAVVERVVPRRDSSGATAFGVRSMVYLAITYDHRLIDGADAARFLGTIKQRLESGFTPAELR